MGLNRISLGYDALGVGVDVDHAAEVLRALWTRPIGVDNYDIVEVQIRRNGVTVVVRHGLINGLVVSADEFRQKASRDLGRRVAEGLKRGKEIAKTKRDNLHNSSAGLLQSDFPSPRKIS